MLFGMSSRKPKGTSSHILNGKPSRKSNRKPNGKPSGKLHFKKRLAIFPFPAEMSIAV
jgi:hypothetical protein